VNDTTSAVEKIIKGREKSLGGFSVRRVLPAAGQRMVGPWIFFDHMGPAQFEAGQGVDVRPHPHINLATVTYLFEGEIFHRDSLGNQLAIQPGEINLMVAGTAFYHYAAEDIPARTINGVKVRVLIGQAYDCTSPVKTFADTLYLEASLQSGQSLAIPADANERAVYVVNGSVTIDQQTLPRFSMAVLTPGKTVTIYADADHTRLAVVGGESLGERHIWWNFVSSRQERIEQAKQDWRHQRFEPVAGDSEEYIPLPDDA